MPSQPKVLFVLTSHSKLGDTGKPTGWYLVRLFIPSSFNICTDNTQPEFAHPYEVLAPHTQITVASPAGGEAPLDPSSVEAFKEDAISTKFLKHSEALWKNTKKLDSFLGHAAEYDAIFFVGGHGRMFFLFLDKFILNSGLICVSCSNVGLSN